jgi:hypothetical protein
MCLTGRNSKKAERPCTRAFFLASTEYSPYASVCWKCPPKLLNVGTWLSLVEHSLGVRGVGSSNLPVPTILDDSTACIFSRELPGFIDLKSVIAGDGHCSSYDPLSEFRVVRVSVGWKYLKTINQIAVCLMARRLFHHRSQTDCVSLL